MVSHEIAALLSASDIETMSMRCLGTTVVRALRTAPAARRAPMQPAAYNLRTMTPGVRFLCSKESKESATAAKEEGDEAAKEGGEAAAAAEDGEEAEEEPSALEVAEAATAKALEERDDLKNQLLRAIAEQENTRTIARRDVKNAKDFAAQSFAKSLLDVSDSLSYALAAASDDKELTVEKMVEGVELTRNQLVKAFASNGLVEFGEVDEAFDPNLHEALFEYEDADKDPATIGQLVKTGFKLHGRVIRAAQVGVVKKAP